MPNKRLFESDDDPELPHAVQLKKTERGRLKYLAEQATGAKDLLLSAKNLGIVALKGSDTRNLLTGLTHSMYPIIPKERIDGLPVRPAIFIQAQGTVQGKSLPNKNTSVILDDIYSLQETYANTGLLVIKGLNYNDNSSTGNPAIHDEVYRLMDINRKINDNPKKIALGVPMILLVGEGNFTHLPSHPDSTMYVGKDIPLGGLASVRIGLDSDNNLKSFDESSCATPAETQRAVAAQWNPLA